MNFMLESAYRYSKKETYLLFKIISFSALRIMFYDCLACNLQIKQKKKIYGLVSEEMESDKVSQGKSDYKKRIYANANACIHTHSTTFVLPS